MPTLGYMDRVAELEEHEDNEWESLADSMMEDLFEHLENLEEEYADKTGGRTVDDLNPYNGRTRTNWDVDVDYHAAKELCFELAHAENSNEFAEGVKSIYEHLGNLHDEDLDAQSRIFRSSGNNQDKPVKVVRIYDHADLTPEADLREHLERTVAEGINLSSI